MVFGEIESKITSIYLDSEDYDHFSRGPEDPPARILELTLKAITDKKHDVFLKKEVLRLPWYYNAFNIESVKVRYLNKIKYKPGDSIIYISYNGLCGWTKDSIFSCY